MVYTLVTYAETFPQNGNYVTSETIKNRCKCDQLPSGHVVHKFRGMWVIEVLETPKEWKNYDIKLTAKR